MSCDIKKTVLLTALQRARSAVAQNDLLPILTFINLRDGLLSAYDGRHAIRVKVPELKGIQTSVKYDKFFKAVEACSDVVTLEVMKTRLEVRSGRFRAKVALVDDIFPYSMKEDEGTGWEPLLDEHFIEALRVLLPLVSQDMSRPWQTGLWLNGTHAYATQNICLARMPCEWPLAPVLLPRAVVQELLSLNSNIECVSIFQNRLLFDCGDYLMDVQTLSDPYSLSVVQMLDEVEKKGVETPIPPGLADAVIKISGFVGDDKFPCVYFGKGGVATEDKEHFAQVTGFELPTSAFNVDAILNVFQISSHLDLKDFPKCPFKGPRVIGMIAGLRT